MDELLRMLTEGQPEMNIVMLAHSVRFEFSPLGEDQVEVRCENQVERMTQGVACLAAWVVVCEDCDIRRPQCILERTAILDLLRKVLGMDRFLEFYEVARRHLSDLRLPCGYYLPRI